VGVTTRNGQTALHEVILARFAGCGSLGCAELLIREGVNVKAQDNCGITALHLAVELGCVPLVELLLGRGASVNAALRSTMDCLSVLCSANGAPLRALFPQDPAWGCTAMHLAARRGDAKLVRILADAGGDVNSADSYSRTPLHVARVRDVITLLSELGCEPNAVDCMGDTPLTKALSSVAPACTVDCVRAMVEAGAGPNRRARRGVPLAIALNLERSDLVEVLLSLGADLRAKTEKGRTILHEIIRDLRPCRIRAIVRLGVDPNAQDNDGVSPLHVAVAAGRAENARALIEVGALPSARDSRGRTPLHLAIGLPDTAKVLIEHGADVNATDSAGETALDLAVRVVGRGVPEDARRRVVALLLRAGSDRELRLASAILDMAVRRGWADVLAAVLKAGVDANERNALDETPLEIATVRGHPMCIKMLVAGGAVVDAVGSSGRTALIRALGIGLSIGAELVSVVHALLEAGASPNMRDLEGNPPLHLAVARRRLDLTEELLACSSIDVAATDPHGRTALHRAAQVVCVAVIPVLANSGIPVDAVDASGSTALHFALSNLATTTALLKFGADPNVKGPDGRPPLHMAVEGRHLDVARELLTCSSIDVSAVDPSGRTALHRAAELGHVEFIDVLVNAGVPLNAADASGSTALDLASGHAAITTALLNAGRRAAAEVDQAIGQRQVPFLGDREPVVEVRRHTATPGSGDPGAAGGQREAARLASVRGFTLRGGARSCAITPAGSGQVRAAMENCPWTWDEVRPLQRAGADPMTTAAGVSPLQRGIARRVFDSAAAGRTGGSPSSGSPSHPRPFAWMFSRAPVAGHESGR
jgi:ankyrin repeat protein